MDAEQRVVGVGVRLMDVVHIVAGDQLDGAMAALPIFAKPAVHIAQFINVVPLQFQEEVFAAEDILIPADLLSGGVILAVVRQSRDFRSQTAAGADQSIGVGGQERLVDARLVVESVQLRGGCDRQQVLIAAHIFRQQQQVMRVAVEAGVAVGHATLRQVGFHADDWLDAGVRAGAIEIQDAEHDAVVGDSQRRHVQRLCPRDQVLDAALSIQQRKLAMHMQVYEVAAHGRTMSFFVGWARLWRARIIAKLKARSG